MLLGSESLTAHGLLVATCEPAISVVLSTYAGLNQRTRSGIGEGCFSLGLAGKAALWFPIRQSRAIMLKKRNTYYLPQGVRTYSR